MKKIKRLKVSKLFYNKWPYKVECIIPGANYITAYDPDYVIRWCKGEVSSLGYRNTKHVNKEDLEKFTGLAKKYLKKKEDIRVRTEGGHFNLFFMDSKFLDKIVKDLEPWVYQITEPASKEELEFLIENENKKILCDAIPHEKYTYKVVLRTLSANAKEQFYQWSKNYTEDQIKISGQTKKWLAGEYGYKQDPFFYIADPSMLTMTRLFLGDGIRRVYEYVPRNALEKG